MRKQLLFLGFSLLSLTGLLAQQTYVDEDFNAGSLPTSWTTNTISGTDNWLFGFDGSALEPNIVRANNIDSTNFAYFDDDNLGSLKTNNTAALETPSFDNSLAGTTTLRFDYNFRDLTGSTDSLIAQVFDGTNWITVFSTAGVDDCGRYAGTPGPPIPPPMGDCRNGFPTAVIDISAHANVNCQVRFVYHDGDDFSYYAGIDNVLISAPVDDDIKVAQIVDPLEVACGLDSNHLPIIKLINAGTARATNFDITFDVNGGTQTITETVTDTIDGGDSLLYQFTSSVDLSATTNYNILVYSTWAADIIYTNDTVRIRVSNEPSFSAPYVDGFEISPGDWKVNGSSVGANSWDKGFPSASVISFASQGNEAWVTNLFGAYNNGEISYLTSPCFDFSAALGDPNVAFDIYYDSEGGFDSLVLQTSIDNGATWKTVPKTVIERNWYNFPKNGNWSWTGESGNWIRAENILSGLAGEGQVKLRFKFQSDFGVSAQKGPQEGFGIDNFVLGFPKAVDLGIQRLFYPIPGEAPDCGYSKENISVRLENRGATEVDTFFISAQVDNQQIVRDTVIQNFPINTIRTYTFTKKVNFTGNPSNNYTLNVWVTAIGDGSSKNDSLRNIRITNTNPRLYTSPVIENFDNNSFTAGTDQNNQNSGINNNWTRSIGATWQVANSGANLPNGSGPSSDHTGNNGNFIYTEPFSGIADDVISIETPCLDFVDKDSLTMEFWYYGYGGPYFDGLHIDVFNGTDWVNDVDIITSFPQTNSNSLWALYGVNLDQFAGARIKIRFSLKLGFPSARSIIAIDDLVIFEPIPQDAQMLSINAPVSDCALNANSLVNVTVNNFGLDVIPTDSLVLAYQIITGFDTTTVKERVPQSIIQRASLTYTFLTTADLSKPGQTYEIRSWSELTGDSNIGNDSIFDYQVTNFTRDPGYIEPFTSFDFLDGDCLAANLDQIGRGWTVSNTQYTWNMQEARICRALFGATPTFGTGPENDHSTNVGDGKFFYTESTLGSRFDEATLTSPCLDFTGRTGVSLAFWYHKFGATMGDLYIDVISNGILTLGVDTVIGQTQTNTTDEWQLKAVNLSQFAGNLIQIRFRGVKSSSSDRGDMAIDDIEFYEPIPQDARVSRVITPITECSPAGLVEVVVENFGTDSILPNTVVVNYSVNGNSPLSDTLPVGIAVGGSVNHIFTILGSFTSPNTQYFISSWSKLKNDSNVFNDSVGYSFTNLTQAIQYKENFEAFIDGACAPGAGEGDGLLRGWEADPEGGGTFHWNVQNAGACGGTPNPNSGPRTDATRGGGQFMYATSTLPGDSAFLYLPCVDFTAYNSAGLTFNYHMFGNQMDTLRVQVYVDSSAVWKTVFKIGGQQQTSKFDPWREGAAKFEEFRGQELRIRFMAGRRGSRGEIAIDDVGFYLPQPIDARMRAVIAPVAGCEIFEQSIVGIEIENFGTDTIIAGTLDLYYQVDNRTPVKEDFPDTLFVDQVATFFFVDSTADLSTLGATYNIKAWTSAVGEGNVKNDTIFTYTVINETKRTNYFEDFELFKDAQCTAALGQVTANGWTVESTDGYTWHVQSSKCRAGNKSTFTDNTGPESDHTTGAGTYLYTDAGNNGAPESKVNGTAIFLSPCIDLQPNTNVRMSFWFHRYGNNVGNMFVDVFANGVWNLGQSISVNGITNANLNGQTQTFPKDNWSKAVVDLDAFAGERVLLRFRAQPLSSAGFRGDMAIDDILLYEPSTIDIGVNEIISPIADLCQVDNDYEVKIRLENFGLNAIDSVELTYSNGFSTSTDTLRIPISSGQNRLYTFTELFDLTLRPGVQDFRVTARVLGAVADTISENNSIRIELNNRQPGLPRYFMDFENHSAGDMQGWRNSPGAGYSWNVVCGAAPWIEGMMPVPPPGPPTGPSGDHTFATTLQNGVGCYMMINSNIVPPPITLPDALLELPCGEMDFSTSNENEILLTFWYHMYGPEMGDLYVDVHDGVTWRNRIDVIRGPLGQMNDDTDRWQRKQVSLSAFAGLAKVKVRFRAEWLSRSGDMGIDDIEILDRAKNDATMVRIIDPSSDCDLTNTEQFRVQFQNTGTEDILESILCYELTFTPYKGVAEVKPIVCDTAVGISGFVAAMAFQTFEFDRVDMSLPGSYEYKVWTKMDGDTYFFNDTIIETVINETRPFPNCDDFSDMVFGQLAKDYRLGKFPNAWVGTTAAFGFKVSIGGNGGGPAVGHTGRNNDAYLLLDDADGMPGQVATVTSPCYDLTNTPAANLEFWYQAPSEGHNVVIEARNTGGQWQPMDTLFAAGGAGGAFLWTKFTIVMTEFVGGFAQVRFTGTNAGDGFFALDDFCMVRPPKQEIELERFVTPPGGLCFYSNAEPVTIRVQNIGLDRITSFQVVLAVDSAFQNFPVGKYLRDTVTINVNSNPFFDPGVKLDVRLDLPNFLVDMSARSQYFFSAYLILPDDSDPTDNLIEDYSVFHPLPIRLPYVEDFEFVKGQGVQGNYTNGIRQLVGGSGFYVWTTRVGVNLNNEISGPATDHTKGKPDDGVYMVTDARAFILGDICVLETRCIDLSTAINPELKYWYFMMGFQMGDLYLEINDDNGWVRIDALFGEDPDQISSNSLPWKSRTISLLPYAGKFVKLRFWSTRGNGPNGDMAIDDLSVIDLAAKDLAAFDLAEPNADTTSCYTTEQKVRVNVRNNGSDSINFPVDSTFIQVIVFKRDNGVFNQIDSLANWVTANTWLDANGNPQPLPPDTITAIEMDNTFDMNDTGKLYKFVVNIQTKGDVITRNDQYTVNVLSQRVGGTTFGASPNDTICFGDQVRVRIKDYFGAIRWEEKVSNRDGQDLWLPGLEFPFDSAYYASIPDSTTKYRIRICNTAVISDSLEVVVIKPFVPKGISAARCDTGFMTVKAKVEDNITHVRMWDSLRGGNLIADRRVPFGYSGNYLETDTFFLEGIIVTPNVKQGFCASINRDTVFGTINVLPIPLLIDSNLEILDSLGLAKCFGYGLKPGELAGGICRTDTFRLAVCQDSSVVLDGGSVVGRQDSYEWTIINPDGSITNSSNTSPDSVFLLREQTLVVDAWLLDVNAVYGFTVRVTSDSGCVNAMPFDTAYVTISDSCITSIEEISSFNNAFDIYPNPVSNELFVKHQSIESFKGSIRLMTVEGQMIQEATDLDFRDLNFKIDMSTLPKGIYIIKVETERGSFVEKIIKS